MGVATQQKVWRRADELLEPGAPDKWIEIIEGEFAPMASAGFGHNQIALNLILLFREFAAGRGLIAGSDNDGFLLERDPDVLFSPDASLFKAERLTRQPDTPWLEFAPEIVAEVLSPSNRPQEMIYKRKKFFDHGTEQIWTLEPMGQSVRVEFQEGRELRADEGSVFDGEGIATGLRVDLGRLFQLPI